MDKVLEKLKRKLFSNTWTNVFKEKSSLKFLFDEIDLKMLKHFGHNGQWTTLMC